MSSSGTADGSDRHAGLSRLSTRAIYSCAAAAATALESLTIAASMSAKPDLAPNDPRRDPKFALLWAAMAEADWLAFTGEEDSPQLRELMAAHRRLVVRQRTRRIVLLVLLVLACATGALFLLR